MCAYLFCEFPHSTTATAAGRRAASIDDKYHHPPDHNGLVLPHPPPPSDHRRSISAYLNILHYIMYGFRRALLYFTLSRIYISCEDDNGRKSSCPTPTPAAYTLHANKLRTFHGRRRQVASVRQRVPTR